MEKVLIFSDGTSGVGANYELRSFTNEVNRYLESGWTIKDNKMSEIRMDSSFIHTLIIFILEK